MKFLIKKYIRVQNDDKFQYGFCLIFVYEYLLVLIILFQLFFNFFIYSTTFFLWEGGVGGCMFVLRWNWASFNHFRQKYSVNFSVRIPMHITINE